MPLTTPIYGLLAEFDDPNALIHAARQAREAGYVRMDAYSPYPIEELTEALALQPTWLPYIVLLGGILGGLTGYLLQVWSAGGLDDMNPQAWGGGWLGYSLEVAGRPDHSWPAFIPVTFELTILGAALSAVFGMLALNGLPRPYHPLFHVPRFALASRDQFFLCIEATDLKFDRQATEQFLAGLSPFGISEVPH